METTRSHRNYFIQKAIEDPGRVHRYLAREYGSEAFNKDGTIKMQFLEKAEMRARENREVSLEKAIILAKRLKGYAKNR